MTFIVFTNDYIARLRDINHVIRELRRLGAKITSIDTGKSTIQLHRCLDVSLKPVMDALDSRVWLPRAEPTCSGKWPGTHVNVIWTEKEETHD